MLVLVGFCETSIHKQGLIFLGLLILNHPACVFLVDFPEGARGNCWKRISATKALVDLFQLRPLSPL